MLTLLYGECSLMDYDCSGAGPDASFLGVGGQLPLLSNRVYRLIIDTQFIVQMGATGRSGRTDIPNDLSLVDIFAFLQTIFETALVGVDSRIDIVMLYKDHFSISALNADEGYPAASCRPDGCAFRGRVINTLVACPLARHGMESITKCRADACSFAQWRVEKNLPQIFQPGSRFVRVLTEYMSWIIDDRDLPHA